MYKTTTSVGTLTLTSCSLICPQHWYQNLMITIYCLYMYQVLIPIQTMWSLRKKPCHCIVDVPSPNCKLQLSITHILNIVIELNSCFQGVTSRADKVVLSYLTPSVSSWIGHSISLLGLLSWLLVKNNPCSGNNYILHFIAYLWAYN